MVTRTDYINFRILSTTGFNTVANLATEEVSASSSIDGEPMRRTLRVHDQLRLSISSSALNDPFADPVVGSVLSWCKSSD